MLARAHRNWNHINCQMVRTDCSACTALLQLPVTNTTHNVFDFYCNADLVWQDHCVQVITQEFAMNFGKRRI
jgi:hypothetical protein